MSKELRAFTERIRMTEFLIDMNLPKRLKKFLKVLGFKSKHSSEIFGSGKTDDSEIIEYCRKYDNILVTNDHDFSREDLAIVTENQYGLNLATEILEDSRFE